MRFNPCLEKKFRYEYCSWVLVSIVRADTLVINPVDFKGSTMDGGCHKKLAESNTLSLP